MTIKHLQPFFQFKPMQAIKDKDVYTKATVIARYVDVDTGVLVYSLSEGGRYRTIRADMVHENYVVAE